MATGHSRLILEDRDRDRAGLHALLRQAARSLGFDPADQSVVLDLAAVAIARLAWRDSPVEDWHAAPDSRIGDADLMRATVNVTRRVRELLDIDRRPYPASARSRARPPAPDPLMLSPAGPAGDTASVLDAVDVQLTEPGRRLPDGRQLRELAPTREHLAAYGDHVHGLRDRWAAFADNVGTHALLLLLACYAAVWCRRWWLGLDWPYLVTEFLARLDGPTRWGSPAKVAHVQGLAPPAQAADLAHLRGLLMAGPDHLDAQTARYCLRAGIGHLLPHDYHRPPLNRRVLPAAVLALVEPVPPGPVPAR
jgi:hypothetical protein